MEKSLTWILGAALLGAGLYFAFVVAGDSPKSAPQSGGAAQSESRPGPASRPLLAELQRPPSGPLTARAGARPNAVEGVVRDVAGNPLDDADVEFVVYKHDTSAKKRLIERMTRVTTAKTVTGKDGSYVLELPPDHDLAVPGTLWGTKAGYVAQYKDWIKAGSKVDFRLARGAVVEGVLKDDRSGAPVAGALVRGWLSTTSEKDADKAFRWQEDLRSDAAGRFKFDGVPEGVVKFLVFHEAYYDYVEDRGVAAGGDNRLEIRLRKGITIEGVALDSVTHEPVAEADVSVVTAPILQQRSFAKTDAGGRFRVEGLEDGPVQFLIVKRGYSDQPFPRSISTEDEFDPKRENRIRFEVAPAGQAAGVVRDAAGAPVAGAKILLADLRQVFWIVRGGAEATTDAGGGFLVGELRPGTSYKIVAADASGLVGLGAEFRVEPGRIHDGLDVRMPRGGGIVGKVSEESGAGVADVVVTAIRPPFYGVTFPPGSGFGEQGVVTAQTNQDGRYELRGLWSGDYRMTFDHKDFVLVDREAVKLQENEEIATHDVALVRGGDIRGKVLRADGSAATGAEVRAYTPFSNEAVAAAAVDADGSYALLRLRPGDYLVKASSADRAESAPGREAVRPGTLDVDFRLRRNPSVVGVVVDQSGRPVSKGRVTLTPADHRAERRTTKTAPVIATERSVDVDDQGGLFRIESVEPGRYLVDVKAPGYAPTRIAEREVGGESDVDLGQVVVRSGGVLRGQISDDRGLPIPDAEVLLGRIGGGPVPRLDPAKSASGASSEASFIGRTDATGRYRIEAAPQGQYLVRVESMRHVPLDPPGQVNLMDGQDESFDAKLGRASGVSVEVRDSTGAPVPHALVEVHDSADKLIPPGPGSERVARTAGDGSVLLSRVPLGPILIRVRKAGYGVADQPITVLEGGNRQDDDQAAKAMMAVLCGNLPAGFLRLATTSGADVAKDSGRQRSVSERYLPKERGLSPSRFRFSTLAPGPFALYKQRVRISSSGVRQHDRRGSDKRTCGA